MKSLGYSGKPIKGRESEPTCKIQMYKDGNQINLVLDGDEIGDQIVFGEYTMIITYYDFFEGTNSWFNLINKDLKVVDVVTPYEFCSYAQAYNVFSDGVDFGMSCCKDTWTLRISKKSYWSYAINDIFQRPPRFWFRKRYLVIKKNA